MKPSRNVLGGLLKSCSRAPMTGYYRNGCCDTDTDDVGCHTVCAIVDESFLRFSASVGNDLSSPTPWFPGLKPGDSWCLCAGRWAEALEAGCAPPVDLEATHEEALRYVRLEDLLAHAARAADA